MERTSQNHPFLPVFTPASRLLILGSFPSVRSRQEGFYYMHPQNRFWKVLSTLYGEAIGPSVAEKTAFLHRHGIALWDSIQSCTVCGSSDATLRDAVANPVPDLLAQTQITRIFCNGRSAHQIYQRYLQQETSIEAVPLPSTSAANAAWSLQRLCEAWQVLLDTDSP